MPRPLKPVSKTARNERRKLDATALNNIGVAFVLAGLLQPAIGYVQHRQGLGLADAEGSVIFILVSAFSFAAARAVIRRLED